MLLLLLHFRQLVAADHALLLTALLVKHLYTQLLAMLVVQSRFLLELRSLSVGQRYFVYFVLLCSGYQLRSVLTLIAHLVKKVSSMFYAVANTQLHRLHKLEFVFVLVLRLCRFQPDLVSRRLKGRLNIDETKVTTQRILRRDLKVCAILDINESITVRANGAHLMPEDLLAATTRINLSVEEALLSVECHLILAVRQHCRRELPAIQVFDDDVKRIAVVFDVEEEYRVVCLQVDLKVVHWVAVSGFKDCLHVLHKLFDDGVAVVFAIQLDEVAHVKKCLLWELLAHPLPLSFLLLI